MFSKNVNDLAVEYMTKKYGEEFSYSGAFGSSYATPGVHKLLVKCGSFDEDILVQAEKDSRGKWAIFSDNYLAHKYEDETRVMLRELSGACWTEVTVIYSAETRTMSSQLPADADFDNYIRDDGTLIYASVVVQSADPLDSGLVEDFAQQLAGRGLSGNIGLIALTPADYAGIDEDTASWISGADRYRYQAKIRIWEGTASVDVMEVAD